jgi:aspartate/methionine/tyrosine aminotransferase
MRAVIDAMNMYNSELCSGVSCPIQHASIKGFEDTPEMTTYMSNSKEILKTISTIFRRTLDEAGFVISKKGALGSYYILLDVTNQPKTPALR